MLSPISIPILASKFHKMKTKWYLGAVFEMFEWKCMVQDTTKKEMFSLQLDENMTSNLFPLPFPWREFSLRNV